MSEVRCRGCGCVTHLTDICRAIELDPGNEMFRGMYEHFMQEAEVRAAEAAAALIAEENDTGSKVSKASKKRAAKAKRKQEAAAAAAEAEERERAAAEAEAIKKAAEAERQRAEEEARQAAAER